MKRISELVTQRPIYGWLFFIGTMAATFVIGLFASSIMERRAERRLLVSPTVNMGEESQNDKWKNAYPREYERWRQTADGSFSSKHAGSALRDELAANPEMVVLWAGYAFSREYTQARGHFHTVEDIRNTLRTNVPQPGTCWTCKSSDVPRVMKEMGVGEFYKAKWADVGHKIQNSVGCIDCHDPATMNLRISRPALVEAFKNQGKNIAQASHQQMRSLVCAQCHVEYHFSKDEKNKNYLIFPWHNGLSVEDAEKYYDKIQHVDYVHALSKTPILKAQHPDYEISQFGIHAQRGVGCADCHMPYRTEGGVKFTDHKIQSPLANVENSCAVCHGQKTAELVANVYERQDKIREIRKLAERQLVAAHVETKAALDRGATEQELKKVHALIRSAQWRWDYAVAGHGNAFHAPLEVARILGNALENAQEARRQVAKILARHGVTEEIPYPDILTKDKAQKFIGLDMKKLQSDKENFIRSVIPKWKEGQPASMPGL